MYFDKKRETYPRMTLELSYDIGEYRNSPMSYFGNEFEGNYNPQTHSKLNYKKLLDFVKRSRRICRKYGKFSIIKNYCGGFTDEYYRQYYINEKVDIKFLKKSGRYKYIYQILKQELAVVTHGELSKDMLNYNGHILNNDQEWFLVINRKMGIIDNTLIPAWRCVTIMSRTEMEKEGIIL